MGLGARAAMLAIQIASDLHLEFYSSSKGGLPPFEEIIQPSAPVLALVGDISDEKGRQLYEAFLAEACGRFKTVVVVLGNHEFYSKHEVPNPDSTIPLTFVLSSFTKSQTCWRLILRFTLCLQRGNDRHIPPVTMDKVIAYVRGLKGLRFPNLELLDNDGVTLDGVRVLGSTLWSDVPPSATQAVERGLNDYHRIFIGAEGGVPRRLRVADTNRLHAEAVAWIERETAEAKERGLSVVVLTHHTPSFRGTSNPVYAGSPIASAFSTDLEHLMGADATSGELCTHPHRNGKSADPSSDLHCLAWRPRIIRFVVG
eukprot:m.391573 g.391573  ORF g.391573 m.391573 type:complete len:313 (+) comp16760_c1_seq7:3989-4927(+)